MEYLDGVRTILRIRYHLLDDHIIPSIFGSQIDKVGQ